MKKWNIISLLFVLSLVLAACGGGGGGAPVDMEKEEVSSFEMDRPKAWKVNSMDMMGITILVASEEDLAAETFLESGDPGEMFGDSPGVFIMAVPPDMAADEGFSTEDIKGIEDEEPGVEIIKQGDITIDGAKGYQLIGKGKFETMGSGDLEMGVHTAVLEGDSLTLVFMGISPKKDMDKNLDIFDYMLKSIKFK